VLAQGEMSRLKSSRDILHMGKSMVAEGRTPAVTVSSKEYPKVRKELEVAGYRQRVIPGFTKEGEVETYVRERPDLGNRWNHVQVVARGGRREIYAHTEASAESAPVAHATGVVTGDANYGAGSRMLKGDLRAARKLMKSTHYRAAEQQGSRLGIGMCSICGNAIWSPVSLGRGIGSWCFRNRRA